MRQLLGWWRRLDARLLQIGFLATFLWLGFREGVAEPGQAALAIATALMAQAAFLRAHRLRGVGFRSAWVTGLGVAILLRSDVLWLPALASLLAIGSKFVLRVSDRHLFNPANFGIGVLLLATGHAWVSPSQ
jgi:Na+-transporting NADH:ubiquinone oxidoreductase subunit NqrB